MHRKPMPWIPLLRPMISATFVPLWCCLALAAGADDGDPRNLRAGLPIPDEGYCDQPYVVITKDGHWLCTMTTGPGREGQKGQHVVATITADRGRSWSKLIDIEPSAGPEASWIVPLLVPSGRVYGFYTYNGDRVDTLRGKPCRADVHGWYVYKYSDDHGRTWSERHRVPLRVTACDRGNDWQGQVQIFWGIDKPNTFGGDAVWAFTKLGKYMLELGEGWVWRSDNILSESDPAKLHWQLLPLGDHGIRRAEFGSVQEEHNLVPLSDGSLYCVYRTGLGFPCHTYSRDGGRTWTTPEPMTYTPGGRKFKTPRACPMVWRTREGKYLFWFHNNTGKGPNFWMGRNPVWIAGGLEKDGHLHWSQPEILLFDPDPRVGMSYPDLIEQDGEYWVTETQKTIARVHPVDKTLLDGLWSQGERKTVAQQGLLLQTGPQAASGALALPKALNLAESSGLTVEAWVRFDDLRAGQVIVDGRTAEGHGLALLTGEQGTVRIELSDGHAKAACHTDPGLLKPKTLHHLVAIADSGPKVLSFVVDGLLCDGGDADIAGWTRFPPELGDVSGSRSLRLAQGLRGELRRLRVYDRYLRTSEAVSHFHAGP